MALKQIISSLGPVLKYKGHFQLGLRSQDLFNGDEIEEAVRRLPDEERNEREQRLKVAFDLFVKKQELPGPEHTTDETDLPYLTPYLNLIERENEERAAFRQ